MMMCNSLMMMTAAIIIVVVIIILTHFLFLYALLQMHFSVSFLLIGSGELASACVTLERLLASVCSIRKIFDINRLIILT